jgi:hypothetical protein
MELVLNRILKTNDYTIGEFSVDGKYLCDTIEDAVRPLPESCPNTPKGIACKCKEKVYGKTAVPAGTYKVKLGYSNRFRRILPQVLDVPHFLGILIHTGNSNKDTEGCIIVGTWDGKTENWVSNSRVAFDKLMPLLRDATDKNEEITITINNI